MFISLTTDCPIHWNNPCKGIHRANQNFRRKARRKSQNGQAKSVRWMPPPGLFPSQPEQEPIGKGKDECSGCIWGTWFGRWGATRVTWKEEKIIHLSSWLGVQSWRDQESNSTHPPAEEPDNGYWRPGASISCKTTFLSPGLQCFSPCYCIFWTQLYNQQTFLHPQTLLRKFHLFLDSSLPLPDHHIISSFIERALLL